MLNEREGEEQGERELYRVTARIWASTIDCLFQHEMRAFYSDIVNVKNMFLFPHRYPNVVKRYELSHLQPGKKNKKHHMLIV